MSAEHIQGRLEYGEDCDSEWWIARVGSTEQIAYTVPVRPGVARANARRLVACWNACEGVPTEMLEAMPSGPAALLPMYAQLEARRDELLAALQEAVGLIEMAVPFEGSTVRKARAAIAKVEGEKT